MGQEFIIKSQGLEDKINQLLPSQGGFQAGVDLSASTQIIPIVDLTETAEGSIFRQDLQTAFSFSSANTFDVQNAETTIISTTGYYRLFASLNINDSVVCKIILSDGTSQKDLYTVVGGNSREIFETIDIIIFNPAGHSIILKSNSSDGRWLGNIRQIADISGNLVNP
tara:strand:- start:136 stop:639 length:504 start_codon:yes stop_codon:yes gene_type:complete